MRRLLPLLAVVALLTSCSNLPRVGPAGRLAATRIRQTCLNHFPKGKWQFVHSIEDVMPDGKKVFVIGIAVISSADRSFHCVIMTLEGLVVFDATYRRRLTVNRAFAPFDSRAFAEGLVKDIRLIFLRPEGAAVESGFLKNGTSICRHREADGGFEDVLCRHGGHWEIRQYAQDDRLLRTVKITSGKDAEGNAGVPKKIELSAHGPQSYKLIMNLIEAVRIRD